MQNPIIKNRIVFDQTFALRLKNFIQSVDACDQPGEEEKEYLLNVANYLLMYQVNTVTDLHEIGYLRNNGLIK